MPSLNALVILGSHPLELVTPFSEPICYTNKKRDDLAAANDDYSTITYKFKYTIMHLIAVVYAFDVIKRNSTKEELQAYRTMLRIIDYLVVGEFLAR
mgnify:FL=1